MMTVTSEPALPQIIVISGLSGSGKSVALRALEDAGWYCIDNLPPNAMQSVVASLRAEKLMRIAISTDARSQGSLDSLPDSIETLRREGIIARLLFLDANDAELVRRFAETRRPHPFSGRGLNLEESIRSERAMLRGFAEDAHTIDTSNLRPNALRSEVKAFASAEPEQLNLFIYSFGFKHGIPQEADFVFDVRMLPNPFYDPALRPLDGRDLPVAEFLRAQPMTEPLLDDLAQLISRWLPAFATEHRHMLTVAIGCTGGQHRSVYIAEQLAGRLSGQHPIRVIHRGLSQ